MKKVVSIDIGSTWTKGGLFVLDDSRLSLVKKAAYPTTQNNLVQGFTRVLAKLLDKDDQASWPQLAGEAEVYFSSSAKGGLGIAAIGLVPDLTLNLARLAAMSAGGKVISSFAFSLTRKDLTELERLQPDIILFSGGTDGGNTKYLLENAHRLKDSKLICPIIYAGNRSVAEDVADIMQNKEVIVTENLMPEIGQVNIEPAREKIREVFLKRIIHGRGLSEIVDLFGSQPRPTPLAVFELIAAIPGFNPEWSDLVAIDVGGATTDLYSNTESYLETDTVVLKGLREPRVKRTVEGDLGMRVSACYLGETGRAYIEERLQEMGIEINQMENFLSKISMDSGYLPTTETEMRLEQILAETCIYYAFLRHAGSWKEVYTPQGKVYVQTGKDLRRIRSIVGSGGFLSAGFSAEVINHPLDKLRHYGNEYKLLPEKAILYRDKDYLFPLLGNLVEKYPEEATALALASVEIINEEVERHA